MAQWRWRLVAAWRALRRDIKSGELMLLALAVIMAVMAVASVSLLANRVDQALRRDASHMLGADVVVRAGQPMPPAFIDKALELDLEVAHTIEFPSMVMMGERSQLVSVKAVSPNYPLRGWLQLRSWPITLGSPGLVSTSHSPAAGQVWIDPQLPALLDLPQHQTRLELGDADFSVEALIAHEPDRSLRFVNIAPRVIMSLDDLPATGLMGPGARASHRFLVAGERDAVNAYKAWLGDNIQPGQRLLTVENSRPEVQRALDRAHEFLSLVALLAVWLAAVALGLAARRYSLRHQDGVAVMRCLGIDKTSLRWILGVEFLSLGVVASLIGLAIGYGVHLLLMGTISQWMGLSFPAADWRPYLLALLCGVVLLLGFVFPPLAALCNVAPMRVLRRELGTLPSYRLKAMLVGALAVAAIVMMMTQELRMALMLVAGFGLAAVLFAAVAHALVWLTDKTKHWFRSWPYLTLALTALSRRRRLSVVQLVALAMGLAILLLLSIIRTDLIQGWQNTIPDDAPNTFLINIQPGQRGDIQTLLTQHDVDSVVLQPLVRARLVGINNQAVEAESFRDSQARRTVRREMNLSYVASLPESNQITQGRWLDPERAEASLEERFAKRLGIKVGDTLRFSVAGESRDVRVVGLRKVRWDSIDVNFFVLLSKAALEGLPANYLTSTKFTDSQAGEITRDLALQFPNVTVFDVTAILHQVQTVLNQVMLALQLLFLFTLSAGLLVLLAALLATRDERVAEAALLRALGASHTQLTRSLRLELLITGVLAGLLAALVAQTVAWSLAAWIFEFDVKPSWWSWLVGALSGGLLSLLGGRFVLQRVLRVPPWGVLRQTQG